MKINDIPIGKYRLGPDRPPFIIAEMSGNHNQSLGRALKIVEAAAASGCHALKLQTYTADTMTIKSKSKYFCIDDKRSLWKGSYLYDLYKKAHTPWQWHKPIFKRCKELGMVAFSAPFDETAVDFLASLNVPAYKIASFENTHLPLIRKVARTGKPVFISTGMATLAEIKEAVRTFRQAGGKHLILLKCTSAYPSLPKEAHLRTIPDMMKQFRCLTGLSDHTLGMGAALTSIAFGARAIEKHFTLKRANGGVDAAFSMEPGEMKQLVQESLRAYHALGKIQYGASQDEKRSKQFRRSIFVIRDLVAGEKLSKDNVNIIRPSNGLAPKYLNQILGKKVKTKIARGTPLRWTHVGY